VLSRSISIIAGVRQSGVPVLPPLLFATSSVVKLLQTRMWANAQRDGRPAKYKWRPLFNAAKFG